jgi:hypothetical protein
MQIRMTQQNCIFSKVQPLQELTYLFCVAQNVVTFICLQNFNACHGE